MLLVARKNLFNERIRLAISVGGVAVSVFLIGILLSLYRGWDEKVGEYVEMVPADLWVAADGTTDFIQAASVLPDVVGTRLGFLPEIDTVSPIIARPVGMVKEGDDPDDDFDIQLVGYDPASLIVVIAPFAQGLVPQFVVFVRWQDILGVTGATLLMALIAAFIPVRRLAQIDPVTVFKG